MRAKLGESRPDARSLRSSDSGDSFLCCSRATCSNSDVMVARTDISAGSNAPGAIHYTGSGSRVSLSPPCLLYSPQSLCPPQRPVCPIRSEEHTSELQSRSDLVCRLLLEKKNKKTDTLRSKQ